MNRFKSTCGYSNYMRSLIDIKPEVEKAIKTDGPVVALESTIITHGMPYPQNLETALNVEQIVRDQVKLFFFRWKFFVGFELFIK